MFYMETRRGLDCGWSWFRSSTVEKIGRSDEDTASCRPFDTDRPCLFLNVLTPSFQGRGQFAPEPLERVSTRVDSCGK